MSCRKPRQSQESCWHFSVMIHLYGSILSVPLWTPRSSGLPCGLKEMRGLIAATHNRKFSNKVHTKAGVLTILYFYGWQSEHVCFPPT